MCYNGGMADIINLFKPEFVFSLAFFIGFIGFGYFVNNSVWPWLQMYLNKSQEIDGNRQARYDRMLDVISEFQREIGAFRETHSIILAYLIADLTENKPETEADSPETRALKRRQSTQDMLLRRLEENSTEYKTDKKA